MKVFFRNDDVNKLERELMDMMSIFKAEHVPLAVAVEPANISQDTIDWLIQKKEEMGKALSIIQHGYNHIEKIPGKGEFGGRSYQDQYKDIQKGKEIMEDIFGSLFFPAFTCPKGGQNKYTVLCLNKLGYKVFTSYHNVYFKNKVLYALGRRLGLTHLLGKRISYHTMMIPGTNLLDISMSMSLIEKYYSANECSFSSLEKLKNCFNSILNSGQSVLGITLHHRYHKQPEHLKLVKDLLCFQKSEDVSFVDMETIYEESQR